MKRATQAIDKRIPAPNPMDKRFIEHPDEWPAWPFLPIKRTYNKEGLRVDFSPECCVLWVATLPRSCGAVIVYAADFFDLPKTAEDFKRTATYCYKSIDEFLADGWEVD